MARYIASDCKLCRKTDYKLFLKGSRCYSDKCALEKRKTIPGQHGASKGKKKTSEYGLRLKEKQRLRFTYGLLEKQFSNYFDKAAKAKGVKGENLLLLLERRLDNIVFKLGFAVSRIEARQLVTHGHFLVNKKKVSFPSYSMKVGDVVEVKEKSKENIRIKDGLELLGKRGEAPWLELNKEQLSGIVKYFPARDEMGIQIQEKLVVEFYSR
ncbi:MAG: 30S ribosomal protein S4 [bacterium]|nr:30S ribosomal protein S4 [bacterium]